MHMLARILFALILVLPLVCPVQAADGPIVIKFSHVVAADAPKGKAAQRFKEVIERRSNGRVKVEIYPNSTLYKDKDEMNALLDGSVQMLAPSLAKIEEFGVKEFEVFNVPYIFLGKDMLRRVTDGPIGQELFKKLEPKGVVGLAYWDNGFRDMVSNKPMRRPADLKGLKMRISSKSGAPLMAALGAIPVEMSLSATHKALQSGDVDGTENVPSNLYTQKMHEVQKYLTVSEHSYIGYGVIANKKFWDSLPADIRVHLKLAMIDATRFANLFAEKENEDALDKIKKSGKIEVYTLSIDERNAWRKALQPVHKEFEARVGKDLMQAIYKEGRALGYKY